MLDMQEVTGSSPVSPTNHCPSQNFVGCFPPINAASTDDRADFVELKLERGHDTEVAAATAQRPQQVGLVLLIDIQLAPLGRDEVRGKKVVAGQAAGATEEADSAAKWQACHAGVGDRAARGGQAMGDRGWIDVQPERSTLRAGGATSRIDADIAHLTEVDGERAIGHAVTRDAMAATPNGDREVSIGRDAYRGRHSFSGTRLHDDRRSSIDESIERAARLLVLQHVGPKDRAIRHPLQGLDAPRGHL